MRAFTYANNVFYGYGMELFQHESVFQYLQRKLQKSDDQCRLVRCFVPKPTRVQMLLGEGFRKVYQLSLEAMFAMWMRGVVHNDIHVNNILYDKTRVKIIDFGKSFLPDKAAEKLFQIGVLSDLIYFTMTFVLAVLHPGAFTIRYPSTDLTHQNLEEVKTSSIALNPEIQEILEGNVPQSQQWMELWTSFRIREGVESPIFLSTDEIRRAAFFSNLRSGLEITKQYVLALPRTARSPIHAGQQNSMLQALAGQENDHNRLRKEIAKSRAPQDTSREIRSVASLRPEDESSSSGSVPPDGTVPADGSKESSVSNSFKQETTIIFQTPPFKFCFVFIISHIWLVFSSSTPPTIFFKCKTASSRRSLKRLALYYSPDPDFLH